MARFWFKSDRDGGRCTGNGCSTVYAPPGQTRTKPRGKASLGRVCYRDGVARNAQWEATVAGTTGYGPTKSEAVRDALKDDPAGVVLWTLQEVHRMTGIPIRTMRDWVRHGHLTSRSDNHTYLVTCGDIRRAADTVMGGTHSGRAQRCPCDANEGTCEPRNGVTGGDGRHGGGPRPSVANRGRMGGAR